MKFLSALIILIISQIVLAKSLMVEFAPFDSLQRANELATIQEFRCNGFTKDNLTTYFILFTGAGGESESWGELRGMESSVPNSLKPKYFQEYVFNKIYDTNEGETVFEGSTTSVMPSFGQFSLNINKVKKSSTAVSDNLWSGKLTIKSTAPDVVSNKGNITQVVTCTSHPNKN